MPAAAPETLWGNLMASTDWIAPAIGLLTAVWAWFRHRDTQPTDQERAALLRTLAEDVAAVVMAAFPGKSWAEYVNMIVKLLLAKPGVPTKNTSALEGAANAALVKLRAATLAAPGVRA